MVNCLELRFEVDLDPNRSPSPNLRSPKMTERNLQSMKLSPRLKTIADLIPADHRVADVGTDHAYIPVYLREQGHKEHIIASDINQGPLDNAISTIASNQLSGAIETRLGGGLVPYSIGEIDTAIIAGMGGILISQILEASMDVAMELDMLILQPMQAQDELREWLLSHSFSIVDEKLVKEGRKYYEIIVVKKGQMPKQDEIYNELGYLLPVNDDPLFIEFLETKVNKYNMIYKSVKNETSESSVLKKSECLTKLKQLEEIKQCVLTRKK